VPARNPKTSYCEIRKVMRGSRGVDKILEIVDVVQGADHAADAVDRFERHMTEEEKQAGITYYWAYISRSTGQSWRHQHPARPRVAKSGRSRGS